MKEKCLYCGRSSEWDPEQDLWAPKPGDEAKWAAVAKDHNRSCEWIITRAHQLPDWELILAASRLGARGGSSRSARKTEAARINGRRGGRPRKDDRIPGWHEGPHGRWYGSIDQKKN